MTIDPRNIPTLQKEIKLLKQVESLTKEVEDLKRKNREKGLYILKGKADKYDSLLKKYQNLMVENKEVMLENKTVVNMMADMRKTLQNVLKPHPPRK